MTQHTRLFTVLIVALAASVLLIATLRPVIADRPAVAHEPARGSIANNTASGAAFSAQINTDTPAPGMAPSVTPVASTATPSLTPPASLPFGAIADQDYRLPPTEIRPTATPIPSAVPTAGPSPTPGPGLDTDLMGVQIHAHITGSEFDAALDHTRNLGMRWVKFQFNWSLLEYAPGQYTDAFYMLRLYVQRAHERGFKVLVSIAKAPGWARTPGPDGVHHEAAPPADPQVLADFVAGMLGMIGTDSAGQHYIDAVEIWNEPNLQREWYGHPITGAEYMRYFAPAYNAVRSVSPSITVITAAPAPTGDSDVSTNDRTWMQQLYNAGLATYGSDVAVGIHPYGWANAPDARCCASSRGWDDQPQFYFLDTIEDYRRIMVDNGHANARMWGTEFGWATFDGLANAQGQRPADPPEQPFYGFIDQWQQAEYVLRAFELAQERDYLGPMIVWNLNFATLPGYVDQSHPQSGYGLLSAQWQPRPVYNVLASASKR